MENGEAFNVKPYAGNTHVAPSQCCGVTCRSDDGGAALAAMPKLYSRIWGKVCMMAVWAAAMPALAGAEVGPTLSGGCPGFAVERPREREGGIVHATDFGFSTQSDKNATAINSALNEARRTGAKRVELAPEKERRILAYLNGTPSAVEAPRDILVNNPDYVVFVPKQPRDPGKRDWSKPGDTYNDHFQVIGNPSNGLLYAFWTQASKEGDIDQHIAFSKSADKGVTWTPPVALAGSPNKKTPTLIASWQQPMLARSGRLYCLWNQQTTSRRSHCGMMFGTFSDDDGETWSAPKLVPFAQRMDLDAADGRIPPRWCNWQRPLRLGEGGKFFVGCSRHGRAPYDRSGGCKVEFWQFENIDEDPSVDDIRVSYFATNRDALDATKIVGGEGFVPREGPAVEEAAIVKLPDGRLFALMRSSIGHPVWSQSRDGGRTWSVAKPLLDRDGGVPFLHPRSPCPLYDWKGPEAASGTYFALIHNTFDFKGKTAYQRRGPLYLIAGAFKPDAEQPIWFGCPKLFAPRENDNSFYTSYCIVDGKGVLWYNDRKFYLCGRIIGPEWFK